LTNDNLLIYFIDNNKTVGHESIIFGIRELNSTEFDIYCINISTDILITDRFFNFSSNYELRIFTSGCYYLDSNNNWQSNGLLVGSLTNHNRTQCFSTHLTSFASSFLVLPNPINWNYVFANANFLKNKTLYITIIIIIIIFLFIAIYARHLDNKDNQKLEVTILSDNQSNDKYLYQMVVFTGIWKNAGTTAKVNHFC
jgi:magnesium-transporting ATPase (P-type)